MDNLLCIVRRVPTCVLSDDALCMLRVDDALGSCAKIDRPNLVVMFDAMPSYRARKLTDAQVSALVFISEHGGHRYPCEGDILVYRALEGYPTASEIKANPKLSRYVRVRPALISHHASRPRLTTLGREVLSFFYAPIPKVRVAS